MHTSLHSLYPHTLILNKTRLVKTRCVLFEILSDNTKRSNETFFIKANNHLITNKDNWHAHLARPIYHLLAFLEIARHIKFGIRNALLFKEVLGDNTEMTSWRAVDGDGFIHNNSIIFRYATSIPLKSLDKNSPAFFAFTKNAGLVTHQDSRRKQTNHLRLEDAHNNY